jgi:prepilin-type N-terminal cleavage/methylation domain-containing protein
MNRRGFSLIELLVVLAISSTLVVIVGPLGYQSIERVKKQTELVALQRWYDRMGYKAFIRGHSVTLDLVDEERLTAVSRTFGVVGERKIADIFPVGDPIVFSSSGIPSRNKLLLKDASGRSYEMAVAGALSVRSGY